MAVKWKQRAITDAFKTRGFSNGTPLAGNGTEITFAREVQMISSEGHAFQRLGRNPENLNIGGPFTS